MVEKIFSKGETAASAGECWVETSKQTWKLASRNFVFPFMAYLDGTAHSIAGAIAVCAFSRIYGQARWVYQADHPQK